MGGKLRRYIILVFEDSFDPPAKSSFVPDESAPTLGNEVDPT
jgi:hypothetical protein